MKKTMVFGTFDVLHKGHLYFLNQAKRHGNLIVIVARDKNVKEIKGKLPHYNENQRFRKIANLKFIKSCFLGDLYDKYKLIEDLKPDIICLGYDQDAVNIEFELKKRKLKTKVIRLRPYKHYKYKSSKIKQRRFFKKKK